MQFSVAMVQLPGNRVAIAVAVIEAGTDRAMFDELNNVFASLRAGG